MNESNQLLAAAPVPRAIFKLAAPALDSALKISDRLYRLEGGTLTRLNPNDYIHVRFDGLFDAG